MLFLMGKILSYRTFLATYKTRGYRIQHLENYKNIFPVRSTETLAGIVADLMGDGNLQGDPKWRIDFTSKYKNELKRFEKEIKSIFDVKCKIRDCSSNIYGKTFNISINCSPIARVLYLCGVPSGQKVLSEFDIPKWIKNNKKFFRRFSQRLFTCEGSIMHEKNRRLPQVRMHMWKIEKHLKKGNKFMENISLYMKKYFGIESTVRIGKPHNTRKDGKLTRPTVIYITGFSVLKFFKCIGFEGSKQERLSNILGMPGGIH